MIKLKTITKITDAAGNVYAQPGDGNVKILFVTCNTREYYAYRLFKNQYGMWYATIRSVVDNTALTEPVEVELNIGYIL